MRRIKLKKLLFFRDYRRFAGGHLKVWHYHEHVRCSDDWRPAIHFTPQSVLDQDNPWIRNGAEIEAQWRPQDADAVFLGGTDWRLLGDDLEALPHLPVLNIIQGLRHADPQDPRFAFLSRKAVRLCVNPLIESALGRTARVQGACLTMPMGLDMGRFAGEVPEGRGLLVAAMKAPELGHRLSEALRGLGRDVRLLDELLGRDDYLQAVADADTVLCLPGASEGFYLPALEAMAMGKLVVCPDCGGNRTYLRDRFNGLLPAYTYGDLLQATRHALALPAPRRRDIVDAARSTALAFDLSAERSAFLHVLHNLHSFWAE